MADKSNPTNTSDAIPSDKPGTSQSQNTTNKPNVPRVIGNFTKLGESSRGGGPKLKFTPNMPSKRNKPEAMEISPVKATPPAPAPSNAASNPTERTERGRGKGRGRGRGTPINSRAAPEMVPAGPFALGPLAAGMASVRQPSGSSSYRPKGTSNLPSTSTSLGGGSTSNRIDAGKNEAKPNLPQNRDEMAIDNAPEVYSDDEGDAIVDLEEVKMLDIMAPDALKKEKRKERKTKQKPKVKSEPVEGTETLAAEDLEREEGKNETQALDLSESEEEIELEDLHEYFITKESMDSMDSLDPGHLYLFQFPSPFPTFQPATTEQTVQAEGDVDLDANPDSSKREQGGKKVTFAEDVKSAASSSATTTTSQLPESQTQQTKAQVPLEGVIGQLEIRQSGAVQMRLSNNTVFDVFAATQPSFLQQVVAFDIEDRRMNVLGSVKRRFVATPDIDALINESVQQLNDKQMDLDQS